MGRGWTFDDLAESTGISEPVHRDFFHKHILFGKDVIYPKYVKFPTSSEEASYHSYEFDMAGMHGAIGSMDACHVTVEKCSHRLKQNHLGGKSKQTCRSYNLTCNHRRQILYTTGGHPARWNDKTIVMYDELARGLKNGTILQDNLFELFEKASDGSIITVKYCGAWLLVDNGYLNWGVTIPPMKQTMYVTETRWSQWLESMRKDVECTFGILKGRWRILKSGIRLHGVDTADNIWMTCCALHNMLLEVDGNSESWDGEEGMFDFDIDVDGMPFALQRLSNPGDLRTYDTSGMGPGTADGEDVPVDTYPTVDDTNSDHIDINDVNEVRFLTADFFQKKLIEHFDILFLQYKIKWPKRKHSACGPVQL